MTYHRKGAKAGARRGRAGEKIKPSTAPTAIQKALVDGVSHRILYPTSMAQRLELFVWTNRVRRFDGQPPSIPEPIKGIYQDTHPEIVIMKAAQVYISEYGINCVLWAADQKLGDRGIGLYVFPKQEQMDDFSQARVGKAIEESTYLHDRVAQIDTKTNRVRLRKVSGSPVYFRGSDSIAQIRSIDADMLICDEVDLFKEDSVEGAKERLGSAMNPMFRAFSQPKYPNGPIDQLFKESDQRYYYIPCEHCGKKQRLTWDDNAEFSIDYTTIRIVCSGCKQPIDRMAEGEWVSHQQGKYARGYHISKLYSPRANLQSMLAKFLAVDDPIKVQSFYNADLGVPYRPQGTPGLESFKREYYDWGEPLKEMYAGIDVGRLLHYTSIGRQSREDPFRLIRHVAVESFDDLDNLWAIDRPILSIIDAQGDPRATRQWVDSHHGRVSAWEHRPSAIDPKFTDEGEVFMHRTALLDLLYGTLRSHSVILHVQAEPEFWSHLEANVREIIKDKDGRMVPRYIPTHADHYAFALSFAILASGLRPTSPPLIAIPKSEVDTDEASVVGRMKSMTPAWSGERRGAGAGKWGAWR